MLAHVSVHNVESSVFDNASGIACMHMHSDVPALGLLCMTRLLYARLQYRSLEHLQK
jgi:hypothetical protein